MKLENLGIILSHSKYRYLCNKNNSRKSWPLSYARIILYHGHYYLFIFHDCLSDSFTKDKKR